MKVLYCSCAVSEKLYKYIYENVKTKPGQEIQKYHRLLINGLSIQEGLQIECLSKAPLNSEFPKKFFKPKSDSFNNVRMTYLPFLNIKGVSWLIQVICAFFMTLKMTGMTDVICINILDISLSLGVSTAAKLKHKKLIGIVTDPLDMPTGRKDTPKYKIGMRAVRKCDGYLLLTEAMNDSVNEDRKKPFIVIEGQADSSMKCFNNTLDGKDRKKIVMYAGSIHKRHGIAYLVEGFIKADISDSELHIYGNGDYVPELMEIVKEHHNVKYFGTRYIDEVVAAEMKATLLVNPRPTDQLFVKYSFPSKNMEYMASGTPILTTRLTGMPKEYYDYIYTIDEESSDGISTVLKDLLSRPREELHKKGCMAKEFILENKSDIQQGRKMAEFLRNLVC